MKERLLKRFQDEIAVLERELKGYQRFLANRLVSAARAWNADEVDLAIGELLRTAKTSLKMSATFLTRMDGTTGRSSGRC